MACNNLPTITDRSDGTWRKLAVVPFPNQVPAERRIPGLDRQVLETEASGILNWAVEGPSRVMERKRFVESQTMRLAVALYRTDNNSVRVWFEQCCEMSPGARTGSAHAYGEYSRWCERTGHKPMNSSNFGREAAKLGIEKTRTGQPIQDGRRGWYYEGLRIVEAELDWITAASQSEQDLGEMAFPQGPQDGNGETQLRGEAYCDHPIPEYGDLPADGFEERYVRHRSLCHASQSRDRNPVFVATGTPRW